MSANESGNQQNGIIIAKKKTQKIIISADINSYQNCWKTHKHLYQ